MVRWCLWDVHTWAGSLVRRVRHKTGAENPWNAFNLVGFGRGVQGVTVNLGAIPWGWVCEGIVRKCGLHRSLHSACGLLCLHWMRTHGRVYSRDFVSGGRVVGGIVQGIDEQIVEVVCM